MNDLSAIIGNLSPAKRELLALRLKKKKAAEQMRAQAIPRRGETGSHPPLSFAQQRLWFLDQLDPDTSVYNIPAALRLSGPLDLAALKRSLNEVIRRHEVLRTSFKLMDAGVVQVIAPPLAYGIETINLSADADREKNAEVLAQQEAQRPFNLEHGPAWRASLLRLDVEEHILLFTMHHIIYDGWSAQVLVGEVTTLYEAFTRGETSPLPELPIQYADYAVWQRKWLTNDVVESQLEYWKQHLSDKVCPLGLPADRPRPLVRSFRGASQSWTFSAKLSEALKELGRQEGATLFMVVLAALKALFHYYSRQDRITIGAPVAHRHRAETQSLIGLFLNTLVLCTDMSGDPGFRELLKRVREVSLGAHAHQDVPLEKLVEALQPERSLSGQPLFQVTYTLQTAGKGVMRLSGLVVRPVKLANETAQFDLVVNGVDSEYGLAGVFEYSTDLFDGATIALMAQHFGEILNLVVAQPEMRLSQIEESLAEAERQQEHLREQEYKQACLQKFMSVKRKGVRAESLSS
jgi:hypothetical protein